MKYREDPDQSGGPISHTDKRVHGKVSRNQPADRVLRERDWASAHGSGYGRNLRRSESAECPILNFAFSARFRTCPELVEGVGMSPVARSPGLRLGLSLVELALEIERHCRADEILQGRLINGVAFVDVNGAPDISF